MRSVRISAWYLPVIELAGLGRPRSRSASAACGCATGRRRRSSITPMTIGTVAFFVLTLNNLFEPVQQLSQLFNMVQSAGAGLNKLFGSSTRPSTCPSARARSTCPSGATSTSTACRSRYATGRRCSTTSTSPSPPGARIALVGPDRRRQVDAGEADGAPVRPDRGRGLASAASTSATPRWRSLRQRIAVIPQEGFLFNGTIRENVRLARAGATDAEVEAALAADRRARAVRIAPRGPRDRGARARVAAVRGREAAGVARPGRARRPRGARARRGHLEPRPRHRGARRGRAVDG